MVCRLRFVSPRSARLSRESGFSLVELAIVLTIIGLLIAGVLKGKELIDNAKLDTVVMDLRNYHNAVENFRNAYKALPGDMYRPQDRLPDCTTAPCNGGGNGDSAIGSPGYSTTDHAYAATSEQRAFWVQLARAKMLDTINPNYSGTPNVPGTDYPKTPMGGAYRAYHADADGCHSTSLCAGNVIRPSARLAVSAAADLLFTAGQAAKIDRKMDDGNPRAGDVIGLGNSDICHMASNPDKYPEADKTFRCNIVYHLR